MKKLFALLLFPVMLGGCAVYTPNGALVFNPNGDAASAPSARSGSTFCPPGQAKKGNC